MKVFRHDLSSESEPLVKSPADNVDIFQAACPLCEKPVQYVGGKANPHKCVTLFKNKDKKEEE